MATSYIYTDTSTYITTSSGAYRYPQFRMRITETAAASDGSSNTLSVQFKYNGYTGTEPSTHYYANVSRLRLYVNGSKIADTSNVGGLGYDFSSSGTETSPFEKSGSRGYVTKNTKCTFDDIVVYGMQGQQISFAMRWTTNGDELGGDYYTGYITLTKVETNVTVYFNANGGSGSMSSQTVKKGNSLTLPSNGFTPPSGYAFSCWNTNSSGTGTDYSPGTSVTISADTTFYAKWEELLYFLFNSNIVYELNWNGTDITEFYYNGTRIL